MASPKSVRVESDTFGPIEVEAHRYWGAQTQRSLQNFKIAADTDRMPLGLVRALAQVKRACARVNQDLGVLDATKAGAIIAAADEVIAGKHDDEFPLAVWQTGSGTQSGRVPIASPMTRAPTGPPRRMSASLRF